MQNSFSGRKNIIPVVNCLCWMSHIKELGVNSWVKLSQQLADKWGLQSYNHRWILTTTSMLVRGLWAPDENHKPGPCFNFRPVSPWAENPLTVTGLPTHRNYQVKKKINGVLASKRKQVDAYISIHWNIISTLLYI